MGWGAAGRLLLCGSVGELQLVAVAYAQKMHASPCALRCRRNATATLWGSHWPEECSHWCHPSAYQLWLLLLNDVLRDARLGSPVWVPERA